MSPSPPWPRLNYDLRTAPRPPRPHRPPPIPPDYGPVQSTSTQRTRNIGMRVFCTGPSGGMGGQVGVETNNELRDEQVGLGESELLDTQ